MSILKDKIVVGAMCINRNVDILKITIPNLLKYSDWVLLLLDNETDEVLNLALDFQRKYYDKIWLRRSSIPHTIIGRRNKIRTYHQRWKGVKGIVRDEVFVNLRRILMLNQKGYDKIDILLFPDQDEIFTDYLPELLEKFWESDKKGVMLKMVHPVNDMKTIKYDKMFHHLHIMKYNDNLCGYPWQYRNIFHPLRGREMMKVEYYSVHLPYLNASERNWRNTNWKENPLLNCDLWKLDKEVEHMSPKEISDTFLRKPDIKFT